MRDWWHVLGQAVFSHLYSPLSPRREPSLLRPPVEWLFFRLWQRHSFLVTGSARD